MRHLPTHLKSNGGDLQGITQWTTGGALVRSFGHLSTVADLDCVGSSLSVAAAMAGTGYDDLAVDNLGWLFAVPALART